MLWIEKPLPSKTTVTDCIKILHVISTFKTTNYFLICITKLIKNVKEIAHKVLQSHIKLVACVRSILKVNANFTLKTVHL